MSVDARQKPSLVLVTGMSGAGKSTAARALEDLGWFVIDNLPPQILPDAVAAAPREHLGDWSGRRRGCAWWRCLRRTGQRPQAVAGQWSRRADALPRGQRRIIGASVREQQAPAPTAGQRQTPRGHRAGTVTAVRVPRDSPTWSSTPLDSTCTTSVAASRQRSRMTNGCSCAPRSCRSGSSTGSRSMPTSFWTFGSCPTPTGCPSCANSPAWMPRSTITWSTVPKRATFLDGVTSMVRLVAEGFLREGKRYITVAIGCTGGKHRSVALLGESERAARARRGGDARSPIAIWGGNDDEMPRDSLKAMDPGRRVGRGPRSCRDSAALRRVTDNLTAVVGVSDDGGSSGRLRRDFGVPPPGDLRMALAALCGDDTWGRTWSRVVQHRFGGAGRSQGAFSGESAHHVAVGGDR